MIISKSLKSYYEKFYHEKSIDRKRAIAAQQSYSHLIDASCSCQRILDVGAGNGALLTEMSRNGYGSEYYALEISGSGVAAIKMRDIPKLIEVSTFDGYAIDYPDDFFDLGIAIHVIEHVEHERIFLSEMARCCKKIIIEAPLENTIFVKRHIRRSSPYGHINFYNNSTFENLLITSGLEVDRIRIYPLDMSYEVYVSGWLVGLMKWFIRRAFLALSAPLANLFFSYLSVAVCAKRDYNVPINSGQD